MTVTPSPSQPRRKTLATMARWRPTAIAVLFTAVLAQAMPALADALAFARIRANGSIDTAAAKNITQVSKPSPGTYCFQLAQPARVGVDSVNAIENRSITAQLFTPQDGAIRLSNCPTGYSYAVMTVLSNGAKVDASFYVAFF